MNMFHCIGIMPAQQQNAHPAKKASPKRRETASFLLLEEFREILLVICVIPVALSMSLALLSVAALVFQDVELRKQQTTPVKYRRLPVEQPFQYLGS